MLKTIVAGIALVAGLGMLSPSEAAAGGFSFRISIGGCHDRVHASFGYGRYYRPRYVSYRRYYDDCGGGPYVYTPRYSYSYGQYSYPRYSYPRYSYPRYRGYVGYRTTPRYVSYRSRYGYGYCR